MHRRFLKLKVVAALFSAAFLFGTVNVGAYTYSGVTSTVDKVAEDENDLIVTGSANVTSNGQINPYKIKTTTTTITIPAHSEANGYLLSAGCHHIHSETIKLPYKPTSSEIVSIKNIFLYGNIPTAWIDAAGNEPFTSYFYGVTTCDVVLNSNGTINTIKLNGGDMYTCFDDSIGKNPEIYFTTSTITVPESTTTETKTENLGESNITVSNNSKLISKGSVQTSKAISVTGSSKLTATGAITGGSIYSDGTICSSAKDSGEAILTSGDIKATGTLRSDTHIASWAGNVSGQTIYAGSNITANNSITAGGIAKASAVNVGGVNASSLITTGNSSIAGVHRITGQTKFNGSVSMNSQKISTLGKGTLSASSTDAVNGAQLYEVQQKVSSAASSGGLSAGGDISISSANAISVNKAGKIASGNTGIVTGGTVYNVTNAIQTSVNSISSTVKKNATSITSLENTMADLKKSVASTNTEVGSTTKNLSSTLSSRLQADLGNLSDDGKSVIKNLIAETLRNMNTASVAATSENGISLASSNSDSALYSSAGEDTLASVSIMPIADTAAMTNAANAVNEKNIANENTASAGIKVASSVAASDLDGVYTVLDKKANKADFSGLKKSVDSNTVAIAANSKSITDNAFAIDTLKTDKAEADGSNINASKYSEKLGIGEVEKGNTGLVTGGTVAKALDTKADTAYVNAGLDLMSNHLESVKQTATHDMNRMGANAAALASLHPQGYNSEDKLDFAAGYGHYRDNNASAVGAFYRPNAATMVSFSGTVGNGDSMVSAGLSFKLGMNANVEKVMITKDAFDKQQATNHAMKGQLDSQTARLQAMEEALSAMIRN